jgi:large subunit ribosomal protein L10
VKNTLLQRAEAALGIAGLDPYLEGPTAIAISRDDPVAPAKALQEFIRQMRKLEVKGALVEGRVMNAEQVKSLADLPGKAQMRARVLGALQAPAAGLVGVLQGLQRNLVYALDQIRKQKEAAA